MNQAIPTKDRVRIHQVEVLSDNWYVLRKTTYDFQGRDGVWRTLDRETYDRGNGATILLYSRAKQTVVLTRQFRFPAFVNEHDGMLIETCAGLLDKDDARTCIHKETEEETGYRIREVRKVFEAFMSPGSVTERLHFFVGEYFDEDKQGEGGGLEHEGEEIEVLELPIDRALAMIDSGEICDGKTIMLLQYAKLHRLLEAADD
ncbi:GDP-mannose pyrophosphatase NudK [Pseudomonas chlororaphis subsp. aurantiaca]|uniref:GDP-mannose pyrophosphatase n=1 Tax=Pseudomonas chlororaphis subsp. aurantiaca TaxID=86192 RepID=A0AAJ0ZLU8_9PSED|nr:GDP-mannose pyrophosphatase NudK [Pseudomonas chlororaphis]AZD25439.1 GDP-mannose pyrophosphatase NudK [Pseudomonas chlororaphis subsp. aurantiaca]AZD39086.1 GDP-mannose pyrophosphatase NudK [Pseudomonas chlororaphis subsp. aurantiaca]AZD45427.1 GDP-mannose pyrophosphatase NudK [Pseudomonas chlororaphis subsp. aurantiaca]AZD57985.1 GDP-mannose pyrophosphatase NudK [Pseudomonas chlororaphis subsp. aurantiaca]AZD63898.1 GDP-mannose pyrophosphatase NudK [Pseudomonas chlororaphis subsp. auranti